MVPRSAKATLPHRSRPAIREPVAVRKGIIRLLLHCHGRLGSRVPDGPTESADAVAKAAGLRNRHRLNSHLTANRPPGLTELARLLRVVWWSMRFEEEQIGLSRQAAGEGRYGSQYSRAVVRALGLPWSVVKARGAEWVVARVRDILRKAG